MLLDRALEKGAASAVTSKAAGAHRVSAEVSKPDLGVAAAAREAGGRERVPNRPPELTLESLMEWAPKYKHQCVQDAYRASEQHLRALLKSTNG